MFSPKMGASRRSRVRPKPPLSLPFSPLAPVPKSFGAKVNAKEEEEERDIGGRQLRADREGGSLLILFPSSPPPPSQTGIKRGRRLSLKAPQFSFP